MEKETIYIGLEYLFGPIQKFVKSDDGNLYTGIKVIDEDDLIQKLDKEINDIWCNLWVNDNNESGGLKFEVKKAKELVKQLIDMSNELLNRLNDINDGSYEIEDMISEQLHLIANS